MSRARYPTLYQVHTRCRLNEISKQLGRPAGLDDIPDSELDSWKKCGFDWVWLLGVWQTGAAGMKVSRSIPEWRQEFREVLPDLIDEDITGSCFAIVQYTVHEDFGGEAALERLRSRMRQRGLKLLLDFVPNHTALDHPWVDSHPDYYVGGSEEDLARRPHDYVKLAAKAGELVLAHGRDPYFPGWPDTLQLNYGNPALQESMIQELLGIAQKCDGVRCDMAMLILPEVFERTWGLTAAPFWPRALQTVRSHLPEFLFLAEVYWDLEWTLHEQGFDFCYDKRFYDRLLACPARPVREHLHAGLDYQDRLVRFLENHDEPRAACCFPPEVHRAAAVLTFFAPGMRLFHEGQLEGARMKVPVHLGRRPQEPVNRDIQSFYARLLRCLKDPVFREGRWQLLECMPAWDGNWTWDNFIASWWVSPLGAHRMVVVNYAPHQGQCYVRFPQPELPGRLWRLEDLMGDQVYDRESDRLLSSGLYLDMPGWGYHVFDVNVLL